ncbi:phosphate transport system permease protein PstA [Vibrio sp. MACH09]|uniref:phosphate ABC transporter permease PstA n=1 Tax=Vibrio sp. MACH09 TaxID=3025122 RepID=UPI0027922048|nr:phosphate ABC transporter permease PstA [Vibrio sp. MACH09]GLO60012.1 phosphate transport system permease protein PstA [Vibrio sp. MACH09]
MSGKLWIWLSGGAVSISLISVFGLLLLIGWKGLTYFWPAPLLEWQDSNGKRIVGQVYQRDSVPIDYLSIDKSELSEQALASGKVERLSIKIANRELYSLDFISLLVEDVTEKEPPKEWAVFERSQNGDFFGRPLAYITENGRYTTDIATHIEHAIDFANTLRIEIERISNGEIRQIGWELNQLRLEKRKQELNQSLTDEYIQQYNERKRVLTSLLFESEAKLELLRSRLRGEYLLVEDMTGQQSKLSLEVILDAWYPNTMSMGEKLWHWAVQVKKFIVDEPREANSEGGVFPAIFGTVFLVLMMSVIVTPLGVIAAVYLHEYAANNALTRLIRVAVINLAGVPSIVYGVFGLGFFVYTIGGSIDEFFYSAKLPTPTFGTPGILWSALTLALLTLPVVIVSTEEGLSRIPSSVRHGSYALGATQFETLWRIVIPMASPAIITGLILAVARAAGEVAPLMLVGVAKLAPSLPVDGNFPYIHLERKFMHLGYHIYDVGFQAPNTEAARPLVYATSFLLVMVVVGLNLTAINIRNNLREKYRSLGQD